MFSVYFLCFSLIVGQRNQDSVSKSEQETKIDRLLQAKRATSRRYANFEEMFKVIFPEHILLLRFYSYGCYCLNIGDRPMTGVMAGYRPQDQIDE